MSRNRKYTPRPPQPPQSRQGMAAVGRGAATPVDDLLKWYTDGMLAFWTAPHNPLREGGPLRMETVQSHIGRLKRFVGWCQENGHCHDPASLCSNTQLVSVYLDFLQQRGTVAGSRATVCDSVLSLLRCLWANPMQSPPWAVMVMQSLRTMRNALVAQYDIELQARSNRESLDEQGRWAGWVEIVAAAKSIVADFQRLHRERGLHDEDKDWSPRNDSSHEW